MDFVRATRASIRRLIEGAPPLPPPPPAPRSSFSLPLYRRYTRGLDGPRRFHVDKGPRAATTRVPEREIPETNGSRAGFAGN